MRKDHKGDLEDNPTLGPKLRPLCPANMAPNSNLGNLMARIVKEMANEIQEKIETEVLSTEELKHHIEKANIGIEQRIMFHNQSLASRARRRCTIPPIQDMNSTIVMSMDVTALYPSISKELAVRTIIKTVKQSNIPWENVDEKQLSRYVALTSDSKLIKDSKLTKCIHKPKTKTTLNSYTNPSKRSRAVNGDNQFIEP